jgi:hypothetical protein
MYEQKDYRACLQQSARVLALRGDAAKPYDLFAVQMRRAECLLNLSDSTTAISAYTAALPLATSPKGADEARAMITLIKASQNLNYVPRGQNTTVIPIVPFATRAVAMKAAFTDLYATSQNAIQTAMQATSLTPIIRFLPQAQDLFALEILGTGKAEKMQPILQNVGQRARDMIMADLQKINAQIDQIQNRANQMVASGNTMVQANGMDWWVGDTRIGLSGDDRNTLRQMLPYLSDVVTASNRGRQAALSFGADGVVWEPVITEAIHTGQRAQGVLEAE